MPNGPYPALGLYWYDDVDPTVPPGMPAPLKQLLIRTDTPAVYYKSGIADTAWTLIGSSTGGSGGVDIQGNGVAVPGNPHTTIDFIGGTTADEGAGTASFKAAAIFDDSTPGTNVNLRSDRAANQSPINNTEAQVTNLGSQDGVFDPAATGATNRGATIGGGDDNSASGLYSTIPGGAANIASGEYSYAEGFGCQALGPHSHAEGILTTADGTSAGSGPDGVVGGSHAEGYGTEATGVHSHAEGTHSVASGKTSHAEGAYCEAQGDYSHAEGYFSVAGPGAHAEGGSTASGDSSHAEGSGCLASGSASHAEGITATAANQGAHAEGYNTSAGVLGTNAFGAHSEGYQSFPRQALGFGAEAWAAHVEGLGNRATAPGAHAEGGGLNGPKTDLDATLCNVASGEGSHAEGQQNTASGIAAHVEGSANVASGDYSHAEGRTSTAAGAYSHAGGFGCSTDAAAEAAFATGQGCAATEDGAFAAGVGATASGVASFAMGLGPIASGSYSHAEGYASEATSEASHAQGKSSKAILYGQDAHACGNSGGPAGSFQTSVVVPFGTTPGIAINESVELAMHGGAQILFEDGKAYTCHAIATIGGTQAGPTRVSKTIELKFNVRRAGGVSTITASGTGDAYGDAAAATWTLVATIGAAPDRIVLTFNTGAGAASLCAITARFEFTEVKFF